MTNQTGKTSRRMVRVMAIVVLTFAIASPAFAQTAAATATPPPAQDDDPDRDVNFSQPDFTLAALPTTLRVPRYKSSFRITHRFARPWGRGDIGDLFGDLFGLDNGALIGLEYRFGLFRGTQIGIHRTSTKIIQLFAQQQIKAQSDSFPIKLDLWGSIDGTDNFTESYSPTIALLISRELGEHGALYLEPIYVDNSNPLPEDETDLDNGTFMIGLGARLRIRPTVYLVVEGAPRVGGYKPDVSHISFGIEKRAGGHLFQLNFSNGFQTTMGQIARGGTSNDDWYMGFNISRKFF